MIEVKGFKAKQLAGLVFEQGFFMYVVQHNPEVHECRPVDPPVSTDNECITKKALEHFLQNPNTVEPGAFEEVQECSPVVKFEWGFLLRCASRAIVDLEHR
jgi:hypothetical protein